MEKFENNPSDDELQHALTTTHKQKIQKEDYPLERERYIEPAINLPSRHYSLEPDCIAGWKPKMPSKANKPKYFNPFPLRYDEEVVDELIHELFKNREKHNEALIYLGPRRTSSYALHQNRTYPNPYRFERSITMGGSGRNGVAANVKLRSSFLKFDSDFESGNLDAVVQRASAEFDLFMRVDTNTRGHTNWFYFQVRNEVFIGSVTFSICNFRRPVSLYQRGLRPYVSARSKGGIWMQSGEEVKYERQRFRYKFLYGESAEMSIPMLNSFYALTFTYKFQMPHDQVRFAYCPPYPYSQLNAFLSKMNNNIQVQPSLRTLSGLAIPVLKIGDDQDDTGKKVALMTARIHPGQSNSSYVAEGFIEFVCSSDPMARQIRSKYIFYVVPMLNPDGVVAGNYRTSLFGKDLNRTFDQSRRFAFPEVFQLLRLGEDLKKRHKKQFCIYVDLHGHSIKKNVFMYGPDYTLQDYNYEISRELPKILGNLTPYFRYYSCSFRISDQKASTGRAVFNRNFNIPYTYTMQSSNGFFFDWLTHLQVPFSEERWREMGVWLAKGLNMLKLQKLPRIVRTHTLKIKKINYMHEKSHQHISDDDINENDSDIDPENQDLPEEMLRQIEFAVKGTRQDEDNLKNVESGSFQGVPQKKKKHKVVEEATRRSRIQKTVSNQSRADRGCALQVPQRKNISFPLVFPVHRTDIFVNRQNRHQKYEKPIQVRLRRYGQVRRMESGKKSVSSSKMEPQEIDVSKHELHFHDLIKKYKFNF